MLKTRLIPVVLFSGYSLVKTVCFDHPRTVGNPIQVVRLFNERQVDELVFLDIDASCQKQSPNFSIIERVAMECYMPLAVGGGIRTLQDIEKLLKIGADKIILNRIALEAPAFINECARVFGSQSILVSIDGRKENGIYRVFSGGVATTRDVSGWCREVADRGAGEILATSIDHEGMQRGYDIEFVRLVASSVAIPTLANGGAGSPEHIVECIKEGKANAACASSIFFFTQFSPLSIKTIMADSGLSVRL